MTTILITLGVFVTNMIVGAVVLALIDDDQRLFQWYDKCPPQIAPVAQPLVLTLWPVVLFMHWRSE